MTAHQPEPLTADEMRARIRALTGAIEAKQRNCRHVVKLVPGIRPYLQCAKCGKRCDND